MKKIECPGPLYVGNPLQLMGIVEILAIKHKKT